MGLLTPNDIKSLHNLYTLQIRYLLSTENQILKGLESMISHTTDRELKQAFETHHKESEVHVERLKVMIGEVNQGDVDDKKDPIITTLIGSGTNIVSESEGGAVRDAGLLATAQKIEHYEIASYGAARDWAKILNLPKHVDLLEKTLEEEKHADSVLGQIAKTTNAEAAVAHA
jgi:ferritin-like metal-binding protein YciE